MSTQRVVDNRTFLLGLDELYRNAMQVHEGSDLLHCAREVAVALDVKPADVPVEGYYVETPALSEYFRLMRTLQRVPESRAQGIGSHKALGRLVEVASSPLYGRSVTSGNLLPAGRDPLAQALLDTQPNWTLAHLVARAHEIALATGDFSLVGLAARVKDAVVLTATRESVVLYAEAIAGTAFRPQEPQYIWRVDEALAQAAHSFVGTFNTLFATKLPAPEAAHAAAYWSAGVRNYIDGRCVRIGFNDRTRPIQHYHWAIARAPDGTQTADEFWHPEIWTTARYRQKLRSR